MDRLPLEHILMHVRDALVTDGRVGELGLDVDAEGDTIVVRGAISNEARRVGVVPVVIEVLERYGYRLAVRDDTHVPGSEAPDREPEAL